MRLQTCSGDDHPGGCGPGLSCDDLWPEATFGAMVGSSLVMRRMFARLRRIAPSEANVLIEGETGTGKELVARELHERGPQRRGPFVTVDCGSLPQTLLEAELFGHTRGAFTDAHVQRPGAIESAHGGTVFLDEIGELPVAMQPRLLRVLESRTVKRLGENHYRPVKVRFLFATHRDLEAQVRSHQFREDLFFRLAVLRVRIPPLRERREDIPALIERLLPSGPRPPLSPHLLEELATRPWSGNVRELRNVLERLVVLGSVHESPFQEELVPPEAPRPTAPPPTTPVADALATALPEDWAALPFREFRAQALRLLESAYLRRLLARHDHRVRAAAAAAQVNRTHLHRLVRRHGL
jgi:two-component system response regulator GlrR